MQFEKEVVYLGMTANKLSDGTPYYSVNFYSVKDNLPVTVNIMGSARDILDHLASAKFGTAMVATFALRPREKLYKLALVHV